MTQTKDYHFFLKEVGDEFPDMKGPDKQKEASKRNKAYKASLEPEKAPIEAAAEKVPEVKKDIPTFGSREEFNAAIADEVKKALQEFKKEIPKAKVSEEFGELVEPVMFFTYHHSHTCMADRRNGRVVIPLEPIRFEHSYRYQDMRGGQADKMVTISTFTSNQAELINFVRNHTLFNIMYFEDLSKVEVRDALFASMIGSMAISVNRLSTQQLVERAKMLPDVKITHDIDNLRHQVIQALTEMEVKAHRQKSELRMRSTLEESKAAGERGVGIGSLNTFTNE